MPNRASIEEWWRSSAKTYPPPSCFTAGKGREKITAQLAKRERTPGEKSKHKERGGDCRARGQFKKLITLIKTAELTPKNLEK